MLPILAAVADAQAGVCPYDALGPLDARQGVVFVHGDRIDVTGAADRAAFAALVADCGHAGAVPAFEAWRERNRFGNAWFPPSFTLYAGFIATLAVGEVQAGRVRAAFTDLVAGPSGPPASCPGSAKDVSTTNFLIVADATSWRVGGRTRREGFVEVLEACRLAGAIAPFTRWRKQRAMADWGYGLTASGVGVMVGIPLLVIGEIGSDRSEQELTEALTARP